MSEGNADGGSRAARSLSGQVVSFTGIGVVSLLAYVVVYLATRVTVSAGAAGTESAAAGTESAIADLPYEAAG